MMVRDSSLGITSGDEMAFWLALNERSSSFSAEVIAKALDHFKSMAGLWTANQDELKAIGFDNRSLNALTKVKSDFDSKEHTRIAKNLALSGVFVIRYVDKMYPRRLIGIDDRTGPPLLLFAKGRYLNFNNCVAIVGSRNCSFHGRSNARKIARRLADKGFTIVSGLARGTDAEAHCGALESRHGRTLAILAWLDPIYPEEHSELVRDIELRGARISENYTKTFGPLTPSKFVDRNRITSGISKFVIAIETDEEGGTIRQAELARAQGRPIFALRPKDNPRANRGFARLITQFNAVEFADDKDLLLKLKENKLEPDKFLEEYDLPPQLKLSAT